MPKSKQLNINEKRQNSSTKSTEKQVLKAQDIISNIKNRDFQENCPKRKGVSKKRGPRKKIFYKPPNTTHYWQEYSDKVIQDKLDKIYLHKDPLSITTPADFYILETLDTDELNKSLTVFGYTYSMGKSAQERYFNLKALVEDNISKLPGQYWPTKVFVMNQAMPFILYELYPLQVRSAIKKLAVLVHKASLMAHQYLQLHDIQIYFGITSTKLMEYRAVDTSAWCLYDASDTDQWPEILKRALNTRIQQVYSMISSGSREYQEHFNCILGAYTVIQQQAIAFADKITDLGVTIMSDFVNKILGAVIIHVCGLDTYSRSEIHQLLEITCSDYINFARGINKLLKEINMDCKIQNI